VSRARRVPAALVALLLATLALGLAWNLVLPANQAPDELAHVSYAQYLAETGSLPGEEPAAPMLSSELGSALSAANGLNASGLPEVDMTWDARAFESWRDAQRVLPDHARSDGAGPNPAASNPPLYYLTTVPAYALGSGGEFFTRLTLMRLVSLAWLLAAMVGGWLLAGELFGRRRTLQTVAAAVVGLLPMNLFIASAVSPDSAMLAMWAITMWLGVRLLRHGPTTRGAFALFLAVGVACVVKATSYALVPAAVLVLIVALVRAHRGPARVPGRQLAVAAGVSVAALVLTLGTWIVVSRLSGTAASAQASEIAAGGLNPREFLSYLWQFYLPLVPGLTPVAGMAPLPVYDTLLVGAWGRFGWLEVRFPEWLYLALTLVTVVTVGLAARYAWRVRPAVRRAWPIVAFLGLIAAALMFGLHLTDYQKGGAAFMQGRYVLPLAPIGGVVAAAAVLGLPTRWRAGVVGVLVGGLLVLNLYSLGLVLERFYA
jgi:4-amino-4-deoxy-L-arabinose transferase-like glycosyltransferase